MSVSENLLICHLCPHIDLTNSVLYCTAGQEGARCLDYAEANQCPKQYFGDGAVTPIRIVRQIEVPHWGPKLWAELHPRPYLIPDLSRELEYLTVTIADRVPCGECRQDWLAMLAANPPDLTNPDSYFASLVAYHNQINTKLGKPDVTAAEARQIWHT